VTLAYPEDRSVAVDPNPERTERKQRRRAERRRSIVSAARQLLLNEGIENFTVSAVAALAHVSKPAVYYYFDSKEDLVAALAIDAYEAELAVLQAATAPASTGVEALQRMVEAYVQHYRSNPDFFRILHMWTRVLGITGDVQRAAAGQPRARLVTDLAQRLAKDQRESRLAPELDPEQLVEVALAMAHGLVSLSGDGPIVSRFGVEQMTAQGQALLARSNS
jgi:AcrR family transcriptional regulator